MELNPYRSSSDLVRSESAVHCLPDRVSSSCYRLSLSDWTLLSPDPVPPRGRGERPSA